MRAQTSVLLAAALLQFAAGVASQYAPRTGRVLQQQQRGEGAFDELLHSMHCFAAQDTIIIENIDWRPSEYYQAPQRNVTHHTTLHSDPNSVLASTCQAQSGLMEFLFPVPRNCSLLVHVYVAATDAHGSMVVHVTGQPSPGSVDLGSVPKDGATVSLNTEGPPSGLLTVALLPGARRVRPEVSGVQIFARGQCETPPTVFRDTTGEADAAGDDHAVVYRMACVDLRRGATQTLAAQGDGMPDGEFVDVQLQLADAVANTSAPSDLFEEVCLPAVDADHVAWELQLQQNTTYEAVLYFLLRPKRIWSDVVVTVGGKHATAAHRDLYAAGASDAPAYVQKRIEFRAEQEKVSLAVSSLAGFPPLSGLEVLRVQAKTAMVGKQLLDRPDDYMVVDCGSELFKQTASGEVVYPASQVFHTVGMKVGKMEGSVKASVPEHQEFVDAGLFNDACFAASNNAIHATLAVVPGKEYNLTFFWTELWSQSLRLMNIEVDGELVAEDVNVLDLAPQGTSASLSLFTMASEDVMDVRIIATAGQPMLSLLAIGGKDIDAAAVGLGSSRMGSGLMLAAACGAPSPEWRPLEPFLAAGFRRFSVGSPVQSSGGHADSVYNTQCFGPQGEPLTIQLAVQPRAQLRVALHFAELVADNHAGDRRFDVLVNGVPQITGVDVAGLVGPKKPLVREFTYIPTTHRMLIQLVAGAGDPIVNALEVYGLQPQGVNTVHVDGSSGATVTSSSPSRRLNEGPPSAEPAVSPATLPSAPGPGPAPLAAPAPTHGDWKVPDGVPLCVPPEFLKEAPVVEVSPSMVEFQAVDPNNWQNNYIALRLSTAGGAKEVTAIKCLPVQGGNSGLDWFALQFEVQQRVACPKNGSVVAVAPGFVLDGEGAFREVIALFEPKTVGTAAAKVRLLDSLGTTVGEVVLTGTGGDPFAEPHVLHPSIENAAVFAMPEAHKGSTVYLDGRGSHTHDPNSELLAALWQDVATDVEVSDAEEAHCFLPFGTYTFKHTIQDSLMQNETATATFVVAPENDIPGTLVHFFNASAKIDKLPVVPVGAFVASRGTSFSVFAQEMPNTKDGFLLRMLGWTAFKTERVTFKLPGVADDIKVYLAVDGEALNGTTFNATAGFHLLDVRVLLAEPQDVTLQVGNSTITSSVVDISRQYPVINELATDGFTKSRAEGLLRGFLLRAPAKVFVGNKTAVIQEQSVSSIAFQYPDLNPGLYNITVELEGRVSNPVPVTITSVIDQKGSGTGGPFSSTPNFGQKSIPLQNAARVIFCHGKLYASQTYSPSGIWEYIVDDAYDVLESRQVIKTPEPYPTGGGRSKWAVLGLACDPRDSDEDFKLYFTLSNIFKADSSKVDGKDMPYSGAVYYVQPNKPDPTAVKVISNLPVSNSDHAINGIDFHNDGRLLILAGSQTNAGIPAEGLGFLPESPLSAAVLAADVRASGFNGEVQYKFLDDAPEDYKDDEDPMDQKFGDWVKNANGAVSTYATGLRNAFGVRVTQTGNVMVTINGPNVNYGPAMVGMDGDMDPVSSVEVQSDDAFYFSLKEDCYCGSANPNRCRQGDGRSCKYISHPALDDNFPSECEPSAVITSPLTGLMQYRSFAFGGAWNNRVFIASYKKHTIRWNPEDGKQVTDKEDSKYPATAALDIIQGPGGVHIATGFPVGAIYINYPIDGEIASHSNPSVYDINPQKALKQQDGANTFVLGGANFDSIQGELYVLFGNELASNVKVVGSSWITGHIPSNGDGTCETDVSVAFGGKKLTMPGIFCYLDE